MYVTDVLVVEYVGGYTPFEADFTEHIRLGKSFRLTAGVDNELSVHTLPPGRVNVVDSGSDAPSSNSLVCQTKCFRLASLYEPSF